MSNARNEISLEEYDTLLKEGKTEKDFENSNDVIIIDITPNPGHYYLPCIIRAHVSAQKDEIRLGLGQIPETIFTDICPCTFTRQ